MRGRLGGGLASLPHQHLQPVSERVLRFDAAGDLGVGRLQAGGAALTFWEPAPFAPRRAAAELLAHFAVSSLTVFGIADMTVGLGAAAGALAYVRATQGDRLGHLTRLQRLATDDAMVLDPTAVETLELVDALLQERQLQGYHWLPSVRGDLLAKLGRKEEARAEFMRAAGLTRNAREQELLRERAART